jgi:hypothetical protein
VRVRSPFARAAIYVAEVTVAYSENESEKLPQKQKRHNITNINSDNHTESSSQLPLFKKVVTRTNRDERKSCC